MKPHRHRIRFIGGPSDGSVVVATSFPFGDKLWMPATPVAVEPETSFCYMPPTRCVATYKVSCKRHTMENDYPAVLYEFEFVGFEPRTRAITSNFRPHSMSPWLGRFVIVISRWRAGLVKWMLAPIKYPLRVPESANDNSGTSRREKLTY